MSVKLLTEHNLEFLSLKGGYTRLSEFTLVKKATLLEIMCLGSIILNLFYRCNSFSLDSGTGVRQLHVAPSEGNRPDWLVNLWFAVRKNLLLLDTEL